MFSKGRYRVQMASGWNRVIVAGSFLEAVADAGHLGRQIYGDVFRPGNFRAGSATLIGRKTGIVLRVEEMEASETSSTISASTCPPA